MGRRAEGLAVMGVEAIDTFVPSVRAFKAPALFPNLGLAKAHRGRSLARHSIARAALGLQSDARLPQRLTFRQWANGHTRASFRLTPDLDRRRTRLFARDIPQHLDVLSAENRPAALAPVDPHPSCSTPCPAASKE